MNANDDDDAAATRRLLDELARLDGAADDAPPAFLTAPSPDVTSEDLDDVDLLLADLLPRSPTTAQFFTFFAAEGGGENSSVRVDEEPLLDLDVDLDLLTDGDQRVELPPTTALVSLKTKPTTTRKSVPRRSAGYDSNRARNERRHELAYLRRKVADMEGELARARSTALTTHSGGAVRSVGHRAARSGGGGIWEQIAGRQRDERRRAERENVRLRATLELQLKVARSLELILNKPALAKSLDEIARSGAVVPSRTVAAESSIGETDRALLRTLLDHVEQIYAQTDALVRDGAAPASAGIRTASSGSLAEIFVTDLMPFALETASKAAWAYFSYTKNYLPVPSRQYYERHDVENVSIEDTVLESSSMERAANGLTAIVKIKQVLRRYVERDRVVIAWSAVSQSVEINGQPFTSCDLREWGCMVLRPANATERRDLEGGGVGDALAPLTVLRSCYFIAPEFRDGRDFVATQDDIGRLTECVLAFTTARMSTWRQRIENILLDEQLAASR